MAKISKPKSSPSIDMTPMVDLGFLLVTFFMLSANFRTDDIAVIDIPSSISMELMPKDYLQIAVDKEGRTYVSFTGNEEVKRKIAADLMEKTKIQLDQKQITTFTEVTEIGCSFRGLPQFLDLTTEQRKELANVKGGGIPVDSLHNELKIWVRVVYDRLNEEGKARFEKMVAENPGMDKKKLAQDMKPKFILKADKDTPYHFVQNVVGTFKDLDMDTKFSFITGMEADPRKTEQ